VPQGSAREFPLHNPILNSDRDLIFTIHRVEVRGVMIPVEHSDHDAKKSTQLWHMVILALQPHWKHPHNTRDERRGQPNGGSTALTRSLHAPIPASLLHEGKGHVRSIPKLGGVKQQGLLLPGRVNRHQNARRQPRDFLKRAGPQ